MKTKYRDNAKLTFAQVIEIRILKKKMSGSALSKKYKVTRRTIRRIVNGYYYKYLPLHPEGENEF